MKVIKSFYKSAFYVLVFVLISFPVLADENTQKSQQLIDAYVQAVGTNDNDQIKLAWSALNKDEEAKAYMRQNMPRLDYLFRVRGLYLELQQSQLNRPQGFGKEPANSEFQDTMETLKEDLSDGAVSKIEKFSVSPKERTPRTNRDIVMDSRGVPRTDNQSIALSNPNQNRLDNKVLLKARTDSFYSAKFQTVPDELVPAGSNFPKSRPPSQADAVIKNAASLLVFKNGFLQNQTVDIYVNDALVGRQIIVPPQGRTFEAYFSPGMNQLRIVGNQSAGEPLSLGISLPEASYIKDRDRWSVRSGQDRQWSVEVKLGS